MPLETIGIRMKNGRDQLYGIVYSESCDFELMQDAVGAADIQILEYAYRSGGIQVARAIGILVWVTSLLILLSVSLQVCFAEEKSKPIVDIRFDAPYRQIEASDGDEWAPTWGRDDLLYTGSNDGTSFGGIASNAVAFGQLEGSDPYHLKGTTLSGMEDYREPKVVSFENASWRNLESYEVSGVRYRFVSCGAATESASCIATSSDAGHTWKTNAGRRQLVYWGPNSSLASFIVFRSSELSSMDGSGRFVYAASYVGVVNGKDSYILGRVPREKIQDVNAADWSFAQADGSWKNLQGASPQENIMDEVGPDGANWKFTNAYSVDGILYAFITRCHYPWQAGDPKHRHIFQDSSVIKSLDRGRTWTRPASANRSAPMFPGQRFGAPYFVWYGKDGAAAVDNADRYVYAVSNDGHFEAGDNYVLGRVDKNRLPELSAADWSFYNKGDGMNDNSWVANVSDAAPILADPDQSGMTGVTYIPSLRRYVMVSWHYTHLSFETAIIKRDLSTVLEFFEAPQPWGPWTRFKSLGTGRFGWYAPVIGQRFQTSISATTASGFLYAAGFTAGQEGGLDPTFYKLNYLPITLSTTSLERPNLVSVDAR